MSNENQTINEIVAVHRDNSGEIMDIQLNDGRIMSRVEAAMKINTGELFIPYIITAESKEGEPYLRSMPDGNRANNLANLPEITDYSKYSGNSNRVIERSITQQTNQ